MIIIDEQANGIKVIVSNTGQNLREYLTPDVETALLAVAHYLGEHIVERRTDCQLCQAVPDAYTK